jgi:uncharacterized protein
MKVFVNLPVANLDRSIDFFGRLGFEPDPRLTDDKAVGIPLGPDVYAMLLAEPYFERFTDRPVVNGTTGTEVMVALGVESRGRVDQLAERASAAGATRLRPPSDHDPMYQRSFADPDGHVWEVFYLDPGPA